MRNTSSKQRPWVVICSREGCIPQVIGAFLTRAGAQGWIDQHWERYPLWAFSTAKLNAVPTAPVAWKRTRAQRLPGEESRRRPWQRPRRRRSRPDREQADRDPQETA